MQEAVRSAFAALAGERPDPELVPMHVAQACARALPVDGAGLSVSFTPRRRLPLGASGPSAAAAERLQFTAGEGPCFTAHAEKEPVMADQDEMAARWPGFAEQLFSETPIRGVVSLPLHDGLRGIGVLDLYTVPPRIPGDVALVDAMAAAEESTTILVGGMVNHPGHLGGPAVLGAPSAQRRAEVWQALGLLQATSAVAFADGLSILRARAFSQDTDVDTVAAQILDRTLLLSDLMRADDTG